MKKVLVLRSRILISGHLAKRLKNEGYKVRIVDIERHEHFQEEEICHVTIDISRKTLPVKNIYGEYFLKKYGYHCSIGVRSCNSNNSLFREGVSREVPGSLRKDIESTCSFKNQQVITVNDF